MVSGFVGVWLCFAVGCDANAEKASPPKASASPTQAKSKSRSPAAIKQAKASLAETRTAKDTLVSTKASAESTPPPAKPDPGPRVYAKSRFVWIRERPTSKVQWIGFLWSGGSTKLKSLKPHYGPGCQKWYEVEPKGFVCADGDRATLDPKDPAYLALAEHAAKLDTAWPHEYGESRGLRRYKSLPSPELQKQREWDLTQHLAQVEAARRGEKRSRNLEGVDLSVANAQPFPLPEFPRTVYEVRDRLLLNSTVAYSKQVDHEGRTFLLSADMSWVPKDRVVPYPKVTFKGIELGKGVELPVAFFRKQDRPKYKRTETGEFIVAGETWKRLSWVKLTGKSFKQGEDEFLETAEAGRFVKKSEAVIPTPQEKTPWGASVGQPDTTGRTPKGRATWLEASVWGGWLIAYEGTQPVYVTLISPGRGGTPVKGKDPLETASTPTGSFPITGKFATATMVAPGDYIHSDVPWTQNFSGPHALHGAYWHNDWGTLKSAGCVNVSPIDGRYLYYFTEPAVPEGWHGVRWLPYDGPATTFVIHS